VDEATEVKATEANAPATEVNAAVAFNAVHESEKREIAKFREHVSRPNDSSYAGLALSGGGIRSATFALGAIQALARKNLIRRFDYVSSVSGGGYLASWLAAWVKRAGEEGIKQVEERLSHPKDGLVEPPQVHFLRQYSNYLTPQIGALSGDSWALIGIYLRNTLLNLLILVLSLSTILLLPRGVVAIARSGISDRLNLQPLHGWPTLIGSGLLMIVAMGMVGLKLRVFDIERSDELRRQAGKTAHPSAVYLRVVLPIFCAAAFLAAFLKDPPISVASWFERRWIWLFAGIGVQLVCWFVGWLASQWGANGGARMATGRKQTLAVLLSSVVSGACAGEGIFLISGRLHHLGSAAGGCWHAMAFGPPLVVLVFLLSGIVQIGVAGVALPDSKREWLGRLGGILMLYALLWILLFGIAIYMPLGLKLLPILAPRWQNELRAGGVVGWIATTLWGVISGAKGSTFKKEPRPESGIDTQQPTSKLDQPSAASMSERARARALKIAPYVFVIGLLALLSLGVDAATQVRLPAKPAPCEGPAKYAAAAATPANASAARRVAPCTPVAVKPSAPKLQRCINAHFAELDDLSPSYYLLGWIALCSILAAVLAWRVDINEFSMHHLYRNRLIRCYLGASHDGTRLPDPFTGFDPSDDIALSDLAPSSGYRGPYHLFNTSLNLVHGEELAWQQRRASSFTLTPLKCGYHRAPPSGMPAKSKRDEALDANAYVPTAEYTVATGPFQLGTAMAVSGAAVSPNMGYYSTAALAFLLTVFNVRLGWWLPNPRDQADRASAGPPLGLAYLFFELFGLTSDRRGYVYLSDGGHFENLGVYELARRRCRNIVVCDASADGDLRYDDLANAIERCRVDLGAVIRFGDLAQGLEKVAEVPGNKPYLFRGTITYFDGTTGTIIYLKPNLRDLPGLPADVHWYARNVDARFPHQSTADQWFNESQFESYRALGERIMTEAVPTIQDALGIARA
jgi:hypothetical protein